MPQITIIVPCYNQAQFLEECLNSVYQQTYSDWECIIVNDESKDNTEDIALQWTKKDQRFKYTKKINGGLSSARNHGLKNALGMYVLPLDCDDYIAPNFLSATLQKLISNNSYAAVGSYVQNFGYQNFVWKCTGGNHIEYLIENKSTATCLYKRELAIAVGGYDENMKKGMEDWDFWIRLTSSGLQIAIIEETLFFYRKKQQSMMTDTMAHYSEVGRYIIQKNITSYQKHLVEIIEHKNNQIQSLTNEKYYYDRLIKNLEKSFLFKSLRYFMYKTGRLG
jgi:glycosyltransferase involved in cell wall biosynthesis